jgi:hypothetical protein
MRLDEIVSINEPSLFYVYVPANIYTGKYYDYQTVRILVSAQSEQQAIQIINSSKDDVLMLIDQKQYNRSKRLVAKPVERNVFFKDDYYVKPANTVGMGGSFTVLTKNGITEITFGENNG